MSKVIWRVLCKSHAANKSNRELLKVGCFFCFFKHALKFFTRWLWRDAEAQGTRKLKKFFKVFFMGHFVNAINKILSSFIDLYSDNLIRFEHEFFDKLMSNVIFDFLKAFWFPFFIDHHNELGKGEIDTSPFVAFLFEKVTEFNH